MKENKPKIRKTRKTPILESTEISNYTFEQSLAGLEQIISELERDDLMLEEALKYFETGIHMVRRCDSQLKSAQGTLKELFKGENGEFVEKVLGLTLESFLNGDSSDE